jgi:DNA-binding transcriptional MerR regulator
MTLSNETFWTLEELAAQAGRALAVDYPGPPNGRAREFPDLRTIRYYTTLGLLARPAAFQGRTALYGPLHLMQLVAIKRLQAQGRSLAEIQLQLVGLPEPALREIARLPAELQGEPASASDAAERTDERGDRSAFWSTPPAPAVPFDTQSAGVMPRQLTGVPLAEGVTLLVEASRPLESTDLEAVRKSAQPLLDLLQARRLLGTNPGPPITQGEAS